MTFASTLLEQSSFPEVTPKFSKSSRIAIAARREIGIVPDFSASCKIATGHFIYADVGCCDGVNG